jgi:hypothetical protein
LPSTKADAFIKKPVKSSTFAEIIKRVMEQEHQS